MQQMSKAKKQDEVQGHGIKKAFYAPFDFILPALILGRLPGERVEQSDNNTPNNETHSQSYIAYLEDINEAFQTMFTELSLVVQVGTLKENSAVVWAKYGNIDTFHLPLSDSEADATIQDIEKAVSRMDAVIKNNQGVYVYCNTGKSLSALVIICYLVTRLGFNYDEACAFVKLASPQINPASLGYRQFLKYIKYYKENVLQRANKPDAYFSGDRIKEQLIGKLRETIQALSPYVTSKNELYDQTTKFGVTGNPCDAAIDLLNTFVDQLSDMQMVLYDDVLKSFLLKLYEKICFFEDIFEKVYSAEAYKDLVKILANLKSQIVPYITAYLSIDSPVPVSLPSEEQLDEQCESLKENIEILRLKLKLENRPNFATLKLLADLEKIVEENPYVSISIRGRLCDLLNKLEQFIRNTQNCPNDIMEMLRSYLCGEEEQPTIYIVKPEFQEELFDTLANNIKCLNESLATCKVKSFLGFFSNFFVGVPYRKEIDAVDECIKMLTTLKSVSPKGLKDLLVILENKLPAFIKNTESPSDTEASDNGRTRAVHQWLLDIQKIISGYQQELKSACKVPQQMQDLLLSSESSSEEQEPLSLVPPRAPLTQEPASAKIPGQAHSPQRLFTPKQQVDSLTTEKETATTTKPVLSSITCT